MNRHRRGINTDDECYGCDHHTHIYNEDGACYEYCERCRAEMARDSAQAKAEWEQWKADGYPVGVEGQR